MKRTRKRKHGGGPMTDHVCFVENRPDKGAIVRRRGGNVQFVLDTASGAWAGAGGRWKYVGTFLRWRAKNERQAPCFKPHRPPRPEPARSKPGPTGSRRKSMKICRYR